MSKRREGNWAINISSTNDIRRYTRVVAAVTNFNSIIGRMSTKKIQVTY